MRDVRRGRDEDPRAARQAQGARRRAGRDPRRHRDPSVEPVAGAADHRHAALPAARTSSCATSSGATTGSGCTCTSRSRGADRAVKVSDGLRAYLPELLAWSASSPFVENVNTRAPLGAHPDLHALLPALRHSGRLSGTGRPFADYIRLLYATGSITDPTRDVVERPAAPRVPDGRDPHLRRAAAPGGGDLARGARRTRSPRGSRAPSTRASRCCCRANREIEENFWRAIRWGLSGDLIDLAHARACARRGRRSRS